MNALYNENDPFCADWLERLIDARHIAPGRVDRRSILDIRPADLAGYDQVHFFAGIGIWSAALRAEGVRDDEPVWTGSCPCQPFSAAGQRGGFDDERHLWPAFHWLIEQRRPPIVLGEQVASPDGLRWLDLVSDDMEGTGYAFGAADTCAAGACVDFAESEEGQATLEWIRGAVLHCPDPQLAARLSDFAAWAGAELGYGPAHIRQRLYWMADRAEPRSLPGAHARIHRGKEIAGPRDAELERCGPTRPVADADGRHAGPQRQQRSGEQRQQPQDCGAGAQSNPSVALGDTDDPRSQGRRERGNSADQQSSGPSGLAGSDWIVCTDGKARPSQPGIFPLVDAWPDGNRVGLLRAAGNAIQFAQARQFIQAAQLKDHVG